MLDEEISNMAVVTKEVELLRENIAKMVDAEIKDSIVPIFQEVDGMLSLLGTGIYITYKETLFLVTAKHVMDETQTPLYTESYERITNLPCQKGFVSETVDVGVYSLNAPLGEIWKPLNLSNVTLTQSNEFFVCGYPGTKTKQYYSADNVRNVVSKFEVFCTTYEKNYSKHGFKIDTRFEIPISFSRKNVISKNNTNVKFPCPKGMSGGALCSLFVGNDGNLKWELAGILTRYDEAHQETMVATNVSYLLKMLCENENR